MKAAVCSSIAAVAAAGLSTAACLSRWEFALLARPEEVVAMEVRIRYLSPLLALAIVAMVGCTEKDPVAVEDEVAGLEVYQAAPSVAERPFKAESSGILYPIGSCGDGVVEFAAEGTGTGTHIGRFDLFLTWCFNLTTGAITDGQAVLTAADGDEIHAGFSGQVIPPDQLVSVYTINGGTGRFEDAEGEMTGPTTAYPDGTWTNVAEGWISYDASDGRNN